MTKSSVVVKKAPVVLLRLIGCLLLISLIGMTAEFLDSRLYLLYGAERVVGALNVIYIGDLWLYVCTNPAAMILCKIAIFFGVAMVILTLSVLVVWWVQRCNLFPRIGKFDKLLVSALIFSVAACGICGGMLSQEYVFHNKRYHAVEDCKTLADYEKLLGRPLFAGAVRESDRNWIDELGKFEKSGFAPGRTLIIFAMDRPRVYILVWMENGRVVQRNGCYQVAAPPPRGGRGK